MVNKRRVRIGLGAVVTLTVALMAIVVSTASVSASSGPASPASKTAPAAHADAPAVPAATRTSTFNFCNTSGGKIGCFSATLTFNNRHSFRLSNISVQDTLCDNRSVIARVDDQSGHRHQFVNAAGCNHTTHPGAVTLTDGAGVHYVVVVLYACSRNTCSTAAFSRVHFNPYW